MERNNNAFSVIVALRELSIGPVATAPGSNDEAVFANPLRSLRLVRRPQHFYESVNIRFVIEEVSCHANALRLPGDDDLLLR